MIKAAENKIARLIFNSYIDILLKRNFSACYLVNELPQIDHSAGIIITPNHFSWWDGFFIDYFNRKIIKRSLHLMMLEEQLNKYWFFRYVGAYSINPASPKSIAETSLYTAKVASSGDNLVIVYPQGEIEPYDKRPVCIKKGIRYILKQSHNYPIVILPIFFKVQYESTKHPSIYVYIGRVFSKDNLLNNFDEYSASFNESLIRLDNASYEVKSYLDLFKN